MADTVRNIMENMIPELQDLEARGYFTKKEIREIVKRRSDFEYLLKRKAARRGDFLRYVEYESKLEELRRLRKEKLRLEGKASIADRALMRRIHFIFERATRKFPGDLRLWLAWLEFCQAQSSKRIFSRVAAKALRLLPNEAGLWAHVASWHYQHQLDPESARALLQAGLRNCPSSEDLWLDYVRFELSYAHKLHARRRVRGIPLPGEGRAEEEAGGDTAQPEEAMRAVINGDLALFAFGGALEALPGSLPLHRKTLEALRPLSCRSPAASRVLEAAYDSLQRNFTTSPEAWDLRACRPVEEEGGEAGPSVIEASCQIYDEAVAALPSAEMYERYASFLLQYVPRLQDTAGLDKLGRKALSVCSDAASADLVSEGLFKAWVSLAEELGDVNEAERASAMGCSKYPASLHLNQRRAGLLVKKLASSEGEPGRKALLASLKTLLSTARQYMSLADLAQLWTGLMEHTAVQIVFLAEALLQTLPGLPKGPLRGGLGDVAGKVLEKVALQQGAAAAKDLLWQIMRCPPPGGSFCHAVLQLDSSMPAFLTDKEKQRVFEAGVDAFGAEDDALWLKYLRHSMDKKKMFGAIYRRAVAALNDPTSFLLMCRQ